MSADKTNVMRSLDQKKIKYKVHEYKESGAVSGVEVAAALGQDPKRAFKTLVTIGKSGNHYVFMVPVAEELDLKKAAKCVGEKNIEMIKSKELLPLTGYIHGGCSPVGMKSLPAQLLLILTIFQCWKDRISDRNRLQRIKESDKDRRR